MTDASTSGSMSPELLEVAERARREPQGQFHSLAHLIDVEALRRGYHRQRPDAAVGIDGVTKETYGQDLEANLQDLHQRLRSKRWRHQPIRRVHIPKGDKGRTRPIGISCFEDKIVQDVLREVLSAVYEQDFRSCSYGFRPGRSAHDALRALNRVVMNGEAHWILEADVASYFDSISHQMLLEILSERVPDGTIRRLVGKCLHVGVLDGADLTTPEEGTAQGSALSPLLGNLYLHHVLDRWFEDEIVPRLRGKAEVIRYCDDFVIGFQRQEDAERVMEVLGKRLAKYGLSLQPAKTRLIPFQRPPETQTQGKGPGTFDFLGFRWYWRRARSGIWVLASKTRPVRLAKSIRALYLWCKTYRHKPIPEQHAALKARIQGHLNYFGVSGNGRSVVRFVREVTLAWYKWLARRGQRRPLTWAHFELLLQTYPLPKPRIGTSIWFR
ncbi:MAG: group II intron reverse transcriptase/maturase [Gemmatimonadota bacterium]